MNGQLRGTIADLYSSDLERHCFAPTPSRYNSNLRRIFALLAKSARDRWLNRRAPWQGSPAHKNRAPGIPGLPGRSQPTRG
jgi:hypothetical protein